jgi:hypothetical protein
MAAADPLLLALLSHSEVGCTAKKEKWASREVKLKPQICLLRIPGEEVRLVCADLQPCGLKNLP